MNTFNSLSLGLKLAILALVAALGFVAYTFVDDLFSKEAETKAEISENQAEAAIESGQDAVNTVTNTYTKEIERRETVRTITNEVNNAQDFDSAHAAGSRGLCDGFGVCAEDALQRPNPYGVQGEN